MISLKMIKRSAAFLLISLLFVSCSDSNKDNNPYTNAANPGSGYGQFGYGLDGQTPPTAASDLLDRLIKRIDLDKQALSGGAIIACQYNCPEVIAADCVRIFSHENGEVKYRTYRKNWKVWENGRDIHDIIGQEVTDAHMSGVVTASQFEVHLKDYNAPIQNRQMAFPDMGRINISYIQTKLGILMPFSANIPAGANFLKEKRWCVIQQ